MVDQGLHNLMLQASKIKCKVHAVNLAALLGTDLSLTQQHLSGYASMRGTAKQRKAVALSPILQIQCNSNSSGYNMLTTGGQTRA